jgi:hypothetical protein
LRQFKVLDYLGNGWGKKRLVEETGISPDYSPSIDSVLKKLAAKRGDIFIEDSLLVLKEDTWNTMYSLGVCYLTAHYLALSEASSSGDSGSIASVASQSVDSTSISFNSFSHTSEAKAYYNSTQYGQRFYAMIMSLGTMAITV